MWSQFGYFGTKQTVDSSGRWEAIEAVCDALSEQLFEHHSESGLWEKLDNCWSDGIDKLGQLLEIQQVTPAPLV